MRYSRPDICLHMKQMLAGYIDVPLLWLPYELQSMSNVDILKARVPHEKAGTAKCPFTSNAQEHILHFFFLF